MIESLFFQILSLIERQKWKCRSSPNPCVCELDPSLRLLDTTISESAINVRDKRSG